MGTRGGFGYRINGVDKIQYNHFDSYPEGLGQKVVKNLSDALVEEAFDELRQKVAALRVVSEESTPTEEDIERAKLAGTVDLRVAGQNYKDWYCLLRNAQPSSAGIWPALEMGVMVDAADFLTDSLFCEWAYIVNLDEGTFEVYRGFQTSPHDKGRYANNEPSRHKPGLRSYWPVALVGTFPLSEIHTWKDTWQDVVNPRDPEDE